MQTSTSSLLRDYILHTKDKTDANIQRGKERMDYYYTFLLAQANNYVVERTKYSKLKADQRSFLLPPDYIKMKRVRVRINSIWYRVFSVLNLDRWGDDTAQEIESSIPVEYTLINEQGNMHIELSDLPNADSDVINFEVMYEGYQDPLLFPEDVTAGTVTIKQGKAAIAGDALTAWNENMTNRFIKVTNGKFWYEIANIASVHAGSLVNYFQEPDVTNATYIIAEIPRLPHEYHKTPLWGAVAEYYVPNNRFKKEDYEGRYSRDLLMLQNKYQSKTQGRVTPGIRVGGPTTNVPRNYPNRLLHRI